MKKVWVFIGVRDDKNCPDCRKAIDGNPYPVGKSPMPGKLACGDNCRHAIQEQEVSDTRNCQPKKMTRGAGRSVIRDSF